MLNMNMKREMMITEIMKGIEMGHANTQRLTDNKAACQENLEANTSDLVGLREAAMTNIKMIKVNTNFNITLESLKKNYSKKRLIALYEKLTKQLADLIKLNVVLEKILDTNKKIKSEIAAEGEKKIIKKIEKIEAIENAENLKSKNREIKKVVKTEKKAKIFKAICIVDDETIVKVSDGKETRKSFIFRLRKEGLTISDRKVKESAVLDFILKHTEKNCKVFSYIVTIEDCENYKKMGYSYVEQKIKEQNERRASR